MNLMHRDIKTENTLMCKTGIVKLADFGLSTNLDNTMAQRKTQAGTPYYQSPEQVLGQHYGFEADIWSLGILLYRLCTLRYPFDPKENCGPGGAKMALGKKIL